MAYKSSEERNAYHRKYYKKKHLNPQPVGRPMLPENERRERLTCRIAVDVLRRVQEVKDKSIAEGMTKWKTTSAVVEGLLLEGLKQLPDAEFVGDALPMLIARKRMEAIAAQREELMGFLEKTRREVQHYIDIGASDSAADCLQSAVEDLHDVTETEWRNWTIDQLTNLFPDQARADPHIRANLDPDTIEDWKARVRAATKPTLVKKGKP